MSDLSTEIFRVQIDFLAYGKATVSEKISKSILFYCPLRA